MVKSKRKATKTFKKISSSLTAGELGWLKQADPYNLKQKMYMEHSADLKKLSQWIDEAINGKIREEKHSLISRAYDEAINEAQLKNKLNQNISSHTQDKLENIKENLESNEENIDESNQLSIEESDEKIIVIDLKKRGYDKLIVGDSAKTFEFKLERPIVVRSKFFSSKAREIVENCGGICIEVKD